MLLDAVADRLHDLPPVAPRHLEEALDAQHVVGADQRREPGAERGAIRDRPALDDKAVEIVVVVLGVEIVAEYVPPSLKLKVPLPKQSMTPDSCFEPVTVLPDAIENVADPEAVPTPPTEAA